MSKKSKMSKNIKQVIKIKGCTKDIKCGGRKYK